MDNLYDSSKRVDATGCVRAQNPNPVGATHIAEVADAIAADLVGVGRLVLDRPAFTGVTSNEPVGLDLLGAAIQRRGTAAAMVEQPLTEQAISRCPRTAKGQLTPPGQVNAAVAFSR
jgi:hypothetical protein